MKIKNYRLLALVFIILGMPLVANCAGAGKATPATGRTGQAGQPRVRSELVGYMGSTDYERMVSEGKAIYDRVGCAQCHGVNGEGSDLAPALAGHDRRQVLSQIRNPAGAMPSFLPSQLSRQEAEMVALYIEDLGGTIGLHIHPSWLRTIDPASHLSMVIVALAYGNASDARHHLLHVIQFVDPGPQLSSQLGETMLDIWNGNSLRAEYRIRSLILQMSPEGSKILSRTYLALALDSLESGALTSALHLEQLLALTDVENRAKVQEVVGLLDAGNWNQAYQKLKLLSP